MIVAKTSSRYTLGQADYHVHPSEAHVFRSRYSSPQFRSKYTIVGVCSMIISYLRLTSSSGIRAHVGYKYSYDGQQSEVALT